MFSMTESCLRLSSVAGFVLACVTAMPATAAPGDAANQVVVRDAATGVLRAPTPEEAQALQARSVVLRRAPASTLPKVHASGARGARLTDDFLSYSVLLRRPDGSVAEQCFETLEAAEAALKAAPVKTHVAPTE